MPRRPFRSLRRWARAARNGFAWAVWCVAAPVADALDALEGALCALGVDADRAASLTLGCACTGAGCLAVYALWQAAFGPAIAPEWLREPVLVEIRLGPSLTMLTRAVAVGTCTALTAAALLAHLFCACLLQLVISRPWVTAVTAGYVIAWHSLSDTVWREPLPEGAEEEAA